jgi:hypothetical protein
LNRITRFVNLINEWLDPLGDLARDENFRGEVLAAAGAKEKDSAEGKAKTKEKLNKLLQVLDDLRKKLGLDKSDIPKVDNIAAFVLVLGELYLVFKALREMLETCDYFGLEDAESNQPDEDRETAVVNAVRAISRFLTQQVLKKKAPRVAIFAEATGILSDESNETKRALDLVLFPFLFPFKSDIDPYLRPVGDFKADDPQRIVTGIFLIASISMLFLEKKIRPAGTFLFNFGYELLPEKDLFPNAAGVANRIFQMQFLPGKSLVYDEEEFIRDEFRDLGRADSMISFTTIPVVEAGAEPASEPAGFQYLLTLELNPSDIGDTLGPVSVKFHPGFTGSMIWGHGINFHTFSSGILGTDPLMTIRYEAGKDAENQEADLNAGDISLQLGPARKLINGQQKDDAEFRLNFEDFSLSLSGEGRDGFIEKILPEKAKINASFSIVYSALLDKFTLEGFDGNEGLLMLFRVDKKFFGKIEVSTLYFGIKPDIDKEGQFRGLLFESSVMMNLRQGPFTMSVDRLGLEARVDFPEKADGNLGGANLNVGLKPPSGVGFLVKGNSVVSGGGFLSIDPENHQYYGAGELTIKLTEQKVDLTLKIVAIIVTRLPDGKKGFSFLLLASVEFMPPRDLPLGFKLKGIGIMVSLHRTMNIDALQDAVRSDRFDSILFPDNPVGNAPTIVKTLNALFPVAEDRYIFSIMARIGWGSKKLADLKAGLFLEVPSPVKMALAGVLKVTVEEGGKKIFKFQVNFLVALDLEKQIVSIDAAVYDSKLLSFEIKGQMFLRYRWGNEPFFLISLGGWHPAFEVPEGLNLPVKQDRITLPLLHDDNPSLVLAFYVAITSNSLQAGFAIDFKMKWSKFRLEAGLSMDALFHRDPCYFIVNFEGKLRIFWGDNRLAGVTVKGEFSGTSPWRIRGKATFEIWIWDYDVDFDKSSGEKLGSITQETDVLPLIERAIKDKNNWQVLLPSARPAQIILRSTENDLKEENPEGSAEEMLLADPLSRLEVVQQVTPLGIRIDKLGFQRVKGFRKFDLAAEAGDDPATVDDFFAAAMFLELEDAEKISRKSFERMKAGISFSNEEKLASGNVRVTPFEYENIMHDPLFEEEKPEAPATREDIFRRWISNNSIARSAGGRQSRARIESLLRKPEIKSDPFVLVDKHSGKKIEKVPGQKSMTGAYYELWKFHVDHPLFNAGVIRESELVTDQES